ncbi:MAG: YdcH family protein [Pseudomonadota bacterium]
MAQHAHMASLEQKHSHLEAMIAEEIQRPAPDTIKLSEWKKEKLRIKEALTRLAHH